MRDVRYVTWHWQKDATTWGEGEKSKKRGGKKASGEREEKEVVEYTAR